MADPSKLGPWVRRFLLEHLVGERNLSMNTQRSYRDTFALLIPFAAHQARKKVDELSVVDVSEKCVVRFLADLEEIRGCSTSTRNQRLAEPSTLLVILWGSTARNMSRGVGRFDLSPSRDARGGRLHIWKSQRWMLCSLRPTSRPLKAAATISCCCSSTIPALVLAKRRNSASLTSIWRLRLAGICHRSESKVRARRSVDARSGRRWSRNCFRLLPTDNQPSTSF